jgi:hypothetical protein
MAGRTARVIAGATLLLFSAPSSWAHDWYPAWCCNDKDCRELSEERGETVLEVPFGWRLWDGRLIERGSERPSPDSKFHMCEEATTRAIVCFFAPPGSS